MTVNEVHITGRLAKVTVEETKNGKSIATLIVEVAKPQWMNSSAMDQIKIKAFGKAVFQCADMREGQIVKIVGRVTGNPWQGKIYTDIVGETFEVLVSEAKLKENVPAASVAADDDQELPF